VATFYEVDLYDSDGAHIDTAAAEANFWNADSSQAAAWAAQAGLTLAVQPNPPALGTYNRNLYSFADFQQWLASQNNVGTKAAAASTTNGLAIGLALVGGLVAGLWLVSAIHRP